MIRSTLRTSAIFLLLGFFPACSGSSGGGGIVTGTAAATSTLDILLSSAGDGGLFALEAEVSEISLVEDSGATSGNLLSESLRTEFVGLQQSAEFLSQAEVPTGSYVGMQVTFAPQAFRALDMAGNDTPLIVSGGIWAVDLERPLTMTAGSRQRLVVELDLDTSLETDLGTGVFLFEAEGEVLVDPTTRIPLREFHGLTLQGSLLDNTVTVDAFRHEGVHFGSVVLGVDSNTEFRDLANRPFQSKEDFFVALRSGLTVLEVRAELTTGGEFSADRIRIVDQGGVRPTIEWVGGRVLRTDETAQTFELLVRDIDVDRNSMLPPMPSPPHPKVITGTWDTDTQFEHSDGTPVLSGDLEVGQFVRARFSLRNATMPYLADEVRILGGGERCLSGVISDVSGLPQEIIVLVKGEEITGYSGLPSGDLEVRLPLGGVEVLLRLPHRPELDPGQLDVGQRVKVCGDLVDLASDPQLNAERIEVRTGRLKNAEVESVGVPGRFEVEGGRLRDFGRRIQANILDVVAAPRARFKGAAGSARELVRLFNSLSPNKILRVDVRGVGSGRPDEIEGYEIKTRVRRRR